MPLPSSLPAQAASATGSNIIAAIFADVPKPKLFHLPPTVSHRPADGEMEFAKKHQPTAIGEAMARGLGLNPQALRGQCGSDRACGDQVQPRLAGAMCLTASFGVACVFSMPMCL